MKVQTINNQNKLNYNQKQPNFKALTGIKFSERLQYNYIVKNELLKMFDHQPIKDIFTKYDGSVKFVDNVLETDYKIAKEIYENFSSPTDIGQNYVINCELNLKKRISELISQLKDFAKKEQVNIDVELNVYENTRAGLSFNLVGGNFFVIDEYNKCDNIEELNSFIEERKKMLESRDSYKQDSDKHDLARIEYMRDIYQKNPDEMKNRYLFAAYNFVDSVKQLDSKKIEELIPEVIKSEAKAKKDLNRILQEAVLKKNTEDKLKELLGENYIDPKKQLESDLPKKAEVKIDKDLEALQEITTKNANKRIKTPKLKSKKTEEK